MDKAGAAAVDGPGQEGHADGFLLGDALERADEVCTFQVLGYPESVINHVWAER